MCRRYGALWAYDYEGEGINVSGPTQVYARGKGNRLSLLPRMRLRSVLAITGTGRGRAPPDRGEPAPDRTRRRGTDSIQHFEGLESFEDLPRDGKCVADYWF
jgi:hypothetical protein